MIIPDVKVEYVRGKTDHDDQKYVVLRGSIAGMPEVTKTRVVNRAAIADGGLSLKGEIAELIADVEEYYVRAISVRNELADLSAVVNEVLEDPDRVVRDLVKEVRSDVPEPVPTPPAPVDPKDGDAVGASDAGREAESPSAAAEAADAAGERPEAGIADAGENADAVPDAPADEPVSDVPAVDAGPV
jgi:hypothetical protein